MTNLSELFPGKYAISTYSPVMIDYAGNGGYSIAGKAVSANVITGICTIQADPIVDAISHSILTAGYTTNSPLLVSVYGTTHATNASKVSVSCQVSSVAKVLLISDVAVMDGNKHSILFAYDATNGTAVLMVDGVDADDTGNATRVAPVVSTIPTGNATWRSGYAWWASSNYMIGNLGALGCGPVYITDPSTFFDSDNNLKKLDETTWTEWTTQPYLWNEHGELSNNKGSFGNFVRVGGLENTDEPDVTAVVVGVAPDAYTPAMMEFDGSTGYYSDTTVTTSGNTRTGFFRFKRETFTGGTDELIFRVLDTYIDVQASVFPSDAGGDSNNILRILAQDTVGAYPLVIHSSIDVIDDAIHSVFWEYDATAGTAQMIIDGVDVLNTGHSGHAITTATLQTGSGNSMYVAGAAGQYLDGEIGCFGFACTSSLDWSDFMDANGNPKALDETTWAEWGSQPLFWNEHGEMTNNLGSAGAMTKNGTIVIGKGGN